MNYVEEVLPKNIIMIGPTGVGKTEIARRMAALVKSPFLKVEASKYTEVGYHGRDVESMIRDITEIGVNMVKAEMIQNVQEKGRKNGGGKTPGFVTASCIKKVPNRLMSKPKNSV